MSGGPPSAAKRTSLLDPGCVGIEAIQRMWARGTTWCKSHGWRIALTAIVLGLAIFASDRHGVPEHLPAAALNWRLLFHVERGVALLAVVGAVLLVGWRAFRGEFPLQVWAAGVAGQGCSGQIRRSRGGAGGSRPET